VTGVAMSGLFVCEGTSDQPLADIVEYLFAERGRTLRLSRPNFAVLKGVDRDVRSKLVAGSRLMDDGPFDIAVVHRDADNAGWQNRRNEIEQAITLAEIECGCIPVIPIRMTEAWLLLDEQEIRDVAGNPNGRNDIALPEIHEVEGVANPKALLQYCLLEAASVRGRRRQTATTRFPQHRRQLLQRLDMHGPVTRLSSWKMLIEDVEGCIDA
jgi:hypothetical protein